jgi:acyl-CoA synthetase (AMP-forming)/AMP-acid ligase II
VRGTPMMQCYWNRPAETAAVMRDGWLHTGDIAISDHTGALRLVGRTKDMIRRAGENVAASEVEAVLCQHMAVLQAAVVPAPDATLGEEVWAFVQLAQRPAQVEPLLQELSAFSHQRLARFKVPRYWSVVSDFPMTPSERIAKHRLKEPPYSQALRHDLASVQRR